MRILVLNKNMTVNFGSPHILRKSVVVILLLNLFLNWAGVLGQNSKVDCSKLAFSLDDMPEELQNYAREPIPNVSLFLKTDLVDTLPGKVRWFYSFTADPNLNIECNYFTLYQRAIRLRRTFPDGDSREETARYGGENMHAAVIALKDESKAQSLYSQVAQSLGNLKQDTIQSAQSVRSLKFTDQTTEKYGEESSTWVIIASLGEGINAVERTMLSSFRIRSFLFVFFADWDEGDFPSSFTDQGASVNVLDPWAPCKDAGLRAIRTWSDRLSVALGGSTPPPPTEGEPPMKISVACDREDKRYESGERVKLNVKIEKLVDYEYDKTTNTYKKGKYLGVSEATFLFKCTFPGGNSILLRFGPNKPIVTESDGTYTFAPFAPYKTGNYKIEVSVNPALDPYGFREYTGAISNMTEFTATRPMDNSKPYLPTKEQFHEIVELFKQSKDVPDHRDDVLARYKELWPKSDPPGPMEYGAYNNDFFCWNERRKSGVEVTISNGFNCPHYRDKTLRFLTKLRFGIGYDDSQRNLLRGIDYGPIVRGWVETSIIENYIAEHHAVLLCHYIVQGETYGVSGTQMEWVLDPWPMQRAAAFGLAEFSGFYTEGWSLLPVYADNEYIQPTLEENSFPTAGGLVYWNLEMKEVPDTYNVDPETGMPGGPEICPIPENPVPEGKATQSITVRCPIAPMIMNDQGQRIGLIDGKLVAEIEKSELFIYPRSNTDLFWHVQLPEGKYSVRLTGTGDADFQVLTTKGDTLLFYNASIRKGEVASLELDPAKSEEPLTLPDGKTIIPTKISQRTGGDRKYQGGTEVAIGIGVVLTFIFILALVIVKRDLVSVALHPKVKKKIAEAEKQSSPSTEVSLEDATKCPFCETINPSYSRFCIKCGRGLEEYSFCEECGKEIPSGSTYCTVCGDKQGAA